MVAVIAAIAAGCSEDEAPQAPATSNRSPAEVPKPVGDEAALDTEEGFVRVRLADCDVFYGKGERSGQTWSEEGNIISTSGQPKGYLHTKKPYGDFTLRCDFRFAEPPATEGESDLPPNTGFLIYIQPPHKQWPASLEVQGRQDEMGSVKANGGAAEPQRVDFDEERRREATKPVGEWNTIEITSRGGALAVVLNGSPVCATEPTDLKEGQIGLQSEGFEVQFRDLRVRED